MVADVIVEVETSDYKDSHSERKRHHSIQNGYIEPHGSMEGHKTNETVKSGSVFHGWSLDRTDVTRLDAAFFCSLFVIFDVGKHVSSYAMKYYNGDKYPLPHTAIVAIIETVKLVVMLIKILIDRQPSNISISFMFALPSFLFAVNANVYYYALFYTTPPVWGILKQFRIILFALVYRVVFKRNITRVQWMALFLLIFGIALTKFSETDNLPSHKNVINLPALLLSFVTAVNSVISCIIMEYMFKKDKRSFVEQLMQLALFGAIISWMFFFTETRGISMNVKPGTSLVVILLMLSCIGMNVAYGFAMKVIVKKLDNVVKIYSQAVSNMATAVVCLFVFPDDVEINSLFMAAILIVFFAIVLYESKNPELIINNICNTIWVWDILKTTAKKLPFSIRKVEESHSDV
ncbi:unnamed protein product [Owenia fusiformis]|uniref:Uncharacterized protein n=1 Tax=Owenia fusiformis TaxID=6347 RepID=A0A8J1TUG1_OWEFU|nr:unnamed protein product [Owenia fusiformis]